MSSLQELDFCYDKFLDRSAILYGETGTGKSFIIVDILYQLKPYADQIIVISPTDRSNHTYDKGLVPLPCIHYTITAKLLDDIWERQNAFATVYTKANKPEIIKKLFDRIQGNYIERKAIEEAYRRMKTYEHEIRAEEADENIIKSKIADMERDCKKFILLIYKHSINANRDKLLKLQLSSDERFSLKYLNFNPRLVLIFDDCTDLLKKFKAHPVIQKIFYQGRWAYVTAIFAAHTDKALDPELKKNAFISIFTEESCAHAYFERKSNDLDRDAKSRATAACKAAFVPTAKHQKLAWVRDEKKFYKFTATPHENFKFGSPIIWEYCKQIQAEAGAINTDNRFIQDFI